MKKEHKDLISATCFTEVVLYSAKAGIKSQDCYFGVCPACGFTDGYLNVGREHYFICHEHRVRWCVGSNLMSSWRFETDVTWAENWNLIKDYTDVAPHRDKQSEEA